MLTQKTFLEFFAGIGLVHLGLLRSGWQCLYANDIAPKKMQMYCAEFGAAPYFHCEDIWNTANILQHITVRAGLATASFPCTDLSLAGQMRGLDGKHSGALFGFLEVMRQLKSRNLMPPLVMLENVVGLVSGHNGAEFQKTCLALAELGYYLDALVVDAKHFTPQSRPRLFIIGALREALPLNVVHSSPRANHKKLWEVMRNTALPTGWITFPLPSLPPVKNNLVTLIDTGDEQDWWNPEATARHFNRTSQSHRRLLEALQRAPNKWVGTGFRRIREGATRVEVRFDGLAGCLRTANGGSARQIVIVVDKSELRMRWMTPREYARLQGAPDFTINCGVNQALTGFGDGVCVPVIEWLDAYILSLFSKVSEAVVKSAFRGNQGF